MGEFWPILQKKKNDTDYYKTLINMLKWSKQDLNNGEYKFTAQMSEYNGFKIFLLFNPHGLVTTVPFVRTSFRENERMVPAISLLDNRDNLITAMKWIDSEAGASYSAEVPQ